MFTSVNSSRYGVCWFAAWLLLSGLSMGAGSTVAGRGEATKGRLRVVVSAIIGSQVVIIGMLTLFRRRTRRANQALERARLREVRSKAVTRVLLDAPDEPAFW